MKYFYDLEFAEGTQTKRILGIPFGKTKPTIDLISIGIVSEDNRELYLISKDFNLKEAWNRYDWKTETMYGDARNIYPEGRKYKEYWIRENVLKPIFQEWKAETNGKIVRLGLPIHLNEMPFTYKNFKYCIKCIGKTNKQIADEVKGFCKPTYSLIERDCGYCGKDIREQKKGCQEITCYRQHKTESTPIFYGYYSAYDHVALCWLFGKMIDLPNGFPYYTRDLQQMIDEKQEIRNKKYSIFSKDELDMLTPIDLNKLDSYPKQTNSHNALSDARWNKQLYDFLQKL